MLGDKFVLTKCPYQNSGLAGANQTWNFSSASTISTYSWSVNANILSGQSFTNAVSFSLNDSTNNQTFTYSFFNDSLISFAGDEFVNNCWYNIYHLVLTYPFNYNDSIPDRWLSPCTIASSTGGSQLNRAKYDAYGTLILPTATFSNVARIKFTSYMSVYNGFGTLAFQGNIYDTTFFWYLPNNKYPVAKLINRNFQKIIGPAIITQEFYYQSSLLPTSVKENIFSSSISVYPNPVNKYLFLHLSGSSKEINYSIKNLYGKSLLSSSTGLVNLNKQIDISTLANGAYFIELNDGTFSTTKKFVVLK